MGSRNLDDPIPEGRLQELAKEMRRYGEATRLVIISSWADQIEALLPSERAARAREPQQDDPINWEHALMLQRTTAPSRPAASASPQEEP